MSYSTSRAINLTFEATWDGTSTPIEPGTPSFRWITEYSLRHKDSDDPDYRRAARSCLTTGYLREIACELKREAPQEGVPLEQTLTELEQFEGRILNQGEFQQVTELLLRACGDLNGRNVASVFSSLVSRPEPVGEFLIRALRAQFPQFMDTMIGEKVAKIAELVEDRPDKLGDAVCGPAA